MFEAVARGVHEGQRNLAVTANACSQVPTDEAELDDEALAR